MCLSSSGRDGGVREKKILLNPKHWDLVVLNVNPDRPVQFIRDRLGAKYDYTGILFSQALMLGWHNPVDWFCSEICAAAIGIADPHRISPHWLFKITSPP